MTPERSRWPVLIAFGLALATLIPWHPHTRTAVLYCVLGPLVCLAAGFALSALSWGRAAGAAIERAIPRITSLLLQPSPGAFCVAVAGASLLLSAASAILLFDMTPGSFDGALYLLTAKVMATGKLVAAAPALPDFFDSPFTIIDEGKWYSQFPPGFPALLSLGVLLGVPWLVNPALGAANAVLVYALARQFSSELEARIAAAIAGLSPLVILMSSEFMNATGALLFATLFMLGVALAVRRDSTLAVALAGAAGGFCFTIRPYTAVAICLVPSLVCLGHILRRRAWKAAAAGVVGAALPLLFLGIYNLATTGDALVLGYERMVAVSPAGQATATWGGSVWNVLARDSLKTLNAMNKDLFQLPFPGLMLAAAAFAFRRPSSWDFLLLLSFLSLLGFYFFYFAHGDLYLGPRYLFEGVSVLAILSARGLVAIRERFGNGAIPDATKQVLLLAAAVGVLLVFPPAMAARMRVVWQHYGDSTIVRAVERQHLENAIVFVPAKTGTRWVACFAANSPTLDGNVVFAQDLGAENEALMELYPGRSAHRWDPERNGLLEIP